MTKKTDNKILKSITPALFFGFKYDADPFQVTNEHIKMAKLAVKEKGVLNQNLFATEELVALLDFYRSKDPSLSSPMMLVTVGVPSGSHLKHKKKTGESIINLHFIGVAESIAEALVIKASELILKNSGYKNLILKLNNIGGKTAQSAFLREGTAYYRKHISDLNIELRQLFKKSLYDLYTQGKNECMHVHENAPEPMDFLDEETRVHFSEMIEFVESLDFTYEVDCHLLGDVNYSSHTIFEILDQKNDQVLVSGTRYNLLAKKIGLKKEVPAISAMIKIKNVKTVSEKTVSNQFKDSKFFLIQMGKLAKIKALTLLSQLSEAGFFVKHSIYRDKISSQLIMAKKAMAPYNILIGQREAIENSAIVKDYQGRWQKTIKYEEIVDFLKSLK